MALYEVTEHYVTKGQRSTVVEAENEDGAYELADMINRDSWSHHNHEEEIVADDVVHV